MKKEHFHYNIDSYDEQQGDKLTNASSIQVVAEDELDALRKAANMLVRPHYRVSMVWECFKDHTIEQELQIAHLEIQSKMLKAIT